MPALRQVVKSRRWAMARGLVAPEWRWAWRNLQGALLFNEGGGNVHDCVGREVASLNGTADWVVTSVGLGVECSAGGESINLPAVLNTSKGSFALVFTGTTGPASWGKYLQAEPIPFQLMRMSNDTQADLQIDGASAIFTFPNIRDGHPHVLVVTWDDVLNVRKLWFDGVLMGTDTTSFTGPTLGSAVYLGNNIAGTRQVGGIYSLFALWDVVLPDERAVTFSHDPFGPFRLWRPKSAFVPAALTAEERRSASGIWLPLIPGVTPNAAKDAEWRQESAWSYSGIAAAGPPGGQPTMIRTQGIPTGPGAHDRAGRWN